MNDILATINAALTRKGLTDAAASRLAAGNPSLIKNMRSSDRGRHSFEALDALAAVLDLECYFGPPRDKTAPLIYETVALDGADFDLVPYYDLDASAGSGIVAATEEITDRLAFSKSWLTRHGIDPANAALVRVRGDSMEPTIPNGATALLQLAIEGLTAAGVYAFSREGEVSIKRLAPTGQVGLVIVSDNPDYPPEFLPAEDAGDLRLIGRVRTFFKDVT